MNDDYMRRVARTAYGPAFARTFTRIPLAHETRAELSFMIKKSDRLVQENVMEPRLIPYFEARYLMTDHIIKEAMGRDNLIHQIVEIAAGLSFRGALMCDACEQLIYRELDQLSMVTLKKSIASCLAKYSDWHSGLMHCSNWMIWPGNALDRNTFSNGLFSDFYRRRKLIFVNEGLLVYLTHDMIAQLGGLIHARLSKHGGGLWITPDIMLRRKFRIAGSKSRRAWYRSVGRSLEQNAFDDVESAKLFYENIGFSVTVRSLTEIADSLVSPLRLGLLPKEVCKALTAQPYFVMKPR
ncbi:MAG: class I SAM-dependent methyltransferase [Patescibacteria group bacterium]|nr:class I SAM-dependent methyltransferase [Patescibacteria group bacterium]MDE1966783.1 class I SAM-dependent methyltransferase [Patescibacteria group bacterium]